MGCTVAEYEETPALTIDWDLELHAAEQRAEKAVAEREAAARRQKQ